MIMNRIFELWATLLWLVMTRIKKINKGYYINFQAFHVVGCNVAMNYKSLTNREGLNKPFKLKMLFWTSTFSFRFFLVKM